MREPIISEQPHDEAEELLPWYVTGQLGATERERVEAHLAACSTCRDELMLERRRMQALRAFSPQVESGWRRLRERIAPPPRHEVRQRLSVRQTAEQIWTALTRPAVVTFAMAQIVLLVFAAGILLWLSRPTYQALGSAGAPASANLIVMFQAGASERDVREALRTAGASMVGGPTPAGAYLIHVDKPRRSAAVASLQSNHKVQLAQPIDAGAGK